MSELSKSILIVDRSYTCGCRLRNSLLVTGATAHVFHSFASALALLRNKKIHTVVVEFDTDPETVAFCDKVRDLRIPVVYSTGSSPTAPIWLAAEAAETMPPFTSLASLPQPETVFGAP